MMERDQEEDKSILDIPFYYQVIKRIKDKNKNLFLLFNKAGPMYKAAIFMLMKRLIEKEEVPKAYVLTSLTQTINISLTKVIRVSAVTPQSNITDLPGKFFVSAIFNEFLLLFVRRVLEDK